jgi:RNA-directed DNA polymerase
MSFQRFASWDDPELEAYWHERSKKNAIKELSLYQQKIAEKQDWKCPYCADALINGEELNLHHVTPRAKGGGNEWNNLMLLHYVCHQSLHSTQK